VVPVGAVLVLGIHLTDTIPDLAADTQAGVRGLAHRLGLSRSLALCWGAFAVGTLLTLALLPFLRYNLGWYLPGLIAGTLLLASGVMVYLRDTSKVRVMSLLLEMGAMSIAVGWVAGITL
jgi:4-hydroxybenzoate polyprenyltransferase